MFDFYKYWLNRLRSKEQCEHHDVEQRVNDYEAPQGKTGIIVYNLILNSDKGEE
jgi:hypothetical protein